MGFMNGLTALRSIQGVGVRSFMQASGLYGLSRALMVSCRGVYDYWVLGALGWHPEIRTYAVPKL